MQTVYEFLLDNIARHIFNSADYKDCQDANPTIPLNEVIRYDVAEFCRLLQFAITFSGEYPDHWALHPDDKMPDAIRSYLLSDCRGALLLQMLAECVTQKEHVEPQGDRNIYEFADSIKASIFAVMMSYPLYRDVLELA